MNIFWINLQKINYKNFLNEIINKDKKSIIFTPNPEILLAIKKDSEFAEILKKANYLTSDWIGLYIAFQILENNFKYLNILFLPYFIFNIFFRKSYLYKKYWDKICGSDLTRDLLDYANKNKLWVVILDLYNPTDVKKVESQKIMPVKLKEKYSNIEFNIFIYREEEKEKIISEINKTDSKIILATLWAKRQEKAILNIMPGCENVKIWLGIWSSIDYLIWFQKRAPLFWRKTWFEWLYRLITWPQKINRLKRIYNAIFVFIYEVIKNK